MKSSFNIYFFIFLAVLAGIAIPTQGSINNKLAEYVNNPILAAFISFCVGTVTLLIYILLTGIPLSTLASAKGIPLIAWTGGIIGAFFVASTTLLIPKLGVALTFSIVVGGQMFTTLFFDHFGILGVPEKPINLWRVFGAILITAGVILIRKF